MGKKKPPETAEELAGELLSGLFGMAGIRIDRAVFVNALGKSVRVRSAETPSSIPPPQPPPQKKQPPAKIPWRVILGFASTPTVDEVKKRYRELSKIYHPEAGGSRDSFEAITAARDAALRELG